MKSKKGCILSFLLVVFIFGVTIPLFMTNHKKIKADTINNLTNTTWYLNGYLNINLDYNYSISFTNNNNNYSHFGIGKDINGNQRTNRLYYDSTLVFNGYSGDDWISNNYRIITITGGNDVTNSNLINWLNDNAENQTPTPSGTQITYHYWSPDGVITMSDNEVYYDTEIEYLIKYNEYRSEQYEDTNQKGLRFRGKTENDQHSYIQAYNGNGYNQLYYGDTNNINNAMWLEFTIGDTMDSDLYDFMSLCGTWFNDANAYLCGTNQGYVEGKIHGRALGQADGTQYEGLITGIFNGLGGLLSIQVFPHITIALLIGLPLLLGVFIIIIKILRG